MANHQFHLSGCKKTKLDIILVYRSYTEDGLQQGGRNVCSQLDHSPETSQLLSVSYTHLDVYKRQVLAYCLVIFLFVINIKNYTEILSKLFKGTL